MSKFGVQDMSRTVSRICPGYVQNSVQDMSRTVSRMCPEHVKWTNGSRVHSILVDCPKCPLDMDVYWTSCGQRVLHSVAYISCLPGPMQTELPTLHGYNTSQKTACISYKYPENTSGSRNPQLGNGATCMQETLDGT